MKESNEKLLALAKIIDPPAFMPSRNTGEDNASAERAIEKARACLRFLKIED